MLFILTKTMSLFCFIKVWRKVTTADGSCWSVRQSFGVAFGSARHTTIIFGRRRHDGRREERQEMAGAIPASGAD